MDKDNSIQWYFEEIYITGLNFNVSEHTILSVTMSFFVMVSSIYYDWKELDMNAIGSNTIAPIKTPIGYYRWKLLYGRNNVEIQDVTEFNFGFTQEVKPQYECRGNKSQTAPAANDLLFGLPSITFGYSQTMHIKQNASYDDALTQMNDLVDLDQTKLSFQLYNLKTRRYEEIFILTGVKEISSTPTLIGNNFKVIRRECNVFGTVEAGMQRVRDIGD